MAEYLEATESRRKKIIQEQLEPDPIRIPYYQKARARMTKAILNKGSIDIIIQAQNELIGKEPDKPWKFHDQKNSILALERFKQIVLPIEIEQGELEIVKTEAKYLPIYGVNIKVSPNLIFRTIIDGQKTIGAVKLHVSKGKQFSRKQSSFVAQILNQFLSNFVAEEDEIVDPRLCLCIDPFAGTTVSAFNKIKAEMKEVKAICKEMPTLFDEVRNDLNSNVA